jgi:hypothetical protein
MLTDNMPLFASATKVVPISSHTYSATLEDAWCLGKGVYLEELNIDLQCHEVSSLELLLIS